MYMYSLPWKHVLTGHYVAVDASARLLLTPKFWLYAPCQNMLHMYGMQFYAYYQEILKLLFSWKGFIHEENLPLFWITVCTLSKGWWKCANELLCILMRTELKVVCVFFSLHFNNCKESWYWHFQLFVNAELHFSVANVRWWLCDHPARNPYDEGLSAPKHNCILWQLPTQRQIVDLHGILWGWIPPRYISQ
jgi:hypothetical protein